MILADSVEWQKAQRGELYLGCVPELIQARDRATQACQRFNTAENMSRRRLIELWRGITQDQRPLPPTAPTPDEDDKLLWEEPWICPPIRADYGVNVHLAPGSMVNSYAVFIDTCPISLGARTLVGPNCSFYAGTHPLDPALRNGVNGPELGKPIEIGEDCWLGGHVIVLPGIRIGRGSVVGAGSVVTKDVPPFHIVAGNPARIIRKIETAMDPNCPVTEVPASKAVAEGAEKPMAEDS